MKESVIHNDPLIDVMTAFEQMHGKEAVIHIQYDDTLHAQGSITIPDEPCEVDYYINIRPTVSANFLPEVLCHELAHILSPPNGEYVHHKEWEKIFDELFDLSCKIHGERMGFTKEE